ncbi:hypothetical protein G7Y79_00030g064600 [Physcia stellaris]|nr:hypothetical protein G7Y79_00030g064600 [Physcia stellaris]
MEMRNALAEEMSPPQNGVHLKHGGTTSPIKTVSSPRFLIIGAGSRGNAYARAVTESTPGIIAAVAEPIRSKRETLGRKYIWQNTKASVDQSFETWQSFLSYETHRRQRQDAGEAVTPGIDGVFICVLDELHAEVILGLQLLNLHVMCEKPLATTLSDCLKIYRSLQPPGSTSPNRVFSIGHVLRYSPHNMLLRKLLLEDSAIGEILSIEHTEPVGWWHFSHSYVRGNWRKESTTAPSLLTKSCHDIDFLLWLLCSPPAAAILDPTSTSTTHANPISNVNPPPPHLPSYVSSTGSLKYFKRANKPPLAGTATNCLSCPASKECIYSAPKIYHDAQLARGNAGWPVQIVDPEIEDLLTEHGQDAADARLRERLGEDYDVSTAQQTIDGRPWFGRCVYESDNDVCDDQIVTIEWEDDSFPTSPLPTSNGNGNGDTNATTRGRGPKTALFHMIAFTEAQCERRGRIYGTKGEISYDSREIRVYSFASKTSKTYYPKQMGGGHGGGDDGLARQFVLAVEATKNGEMGVQAAQSQFVGCTLEEAVRSHAMVFAAEEARKGRKVVEWEGWWRDNVLASQATL